MSVAPEPRWIRTSRIFVALVAVAAVALTAVINATAGQPGAEKGDGVEVAADVALVGRFSSAPVEADRSVVWADEVAVAEALWASYGFDGAVPELDGGALLFVSTGESGTCPLRVESASVDASRVRVALTSQPVGQPDGSATVAACTRDLRPVTFVFRSGAGVVAPPFAVAFDDVELYVPHDYEQGTLVAVGPAEGELGEGEGRSELADLLERALVEAGYAPFDFSEAGGTVTLHVETVTGPAAVTVRAEVGDASFKTVTTEKVDGVLVYHGTQDVFPAGAFVCDDVRFTVVAGDADTTAGIARRLVASAARTCTASAANYPLTEAG